MTETRTMLLTPAAMIKTRRQRWLWKDRIPLGTATIFAGMGGEGKSTFALHIAAQAQRGQLDGDLYGHGTNIIIVSHEDDWGTVMNPRLLAQGADLHGVSQLTVRWTMDDVSGESVPALPMDLNIIREAVAETNARLIIFDPITSTIGGDLYKVADVRRALDPLAQLAQELDIAVIGIMHFNKGTGNASNKLSGSHAFRDVVRSILLFATDDETGQRVVSVDKSNYSRERGSSFAFNLVSTSIPTDDGEAAEVARVEYLGDTDISVSDIINRTPHDGDAADDRNEAERWLIGYLEERGGVAPAGDIRKAALADGFEWRTVQKWSRGVTEKKKTGYQGSWAWTLDLTKGASKDSKGTRSPNTGTFGTFGHSFEDVNA